MPVSQKSAAQFLLMTLAVVAWTYWAPLIVAVATNTLEPESIELRVRSVSETFNVQLKQQASAKTRMRQLRADIALADYDNLKPLLEAYADISAYEQDSPPQIHIAKYANSQARHYFFASYLSLSVLIGLYARSTSKKSSVQTTHVPTVQFGFLFYVFFNWSNWWRNSPWGQTERTLFSYAHFDINPLGFAMQELQVMGMMILCGHVVVLSLKQTPAILSSQPNVGELSKFVRHEFETWQLRSVLLAFAFLPWTIFYWHIVTSIGESRYFPSAISIHVIWAFLWILISTPAWRAFHAWQSFTVDPSNVRSLDQIKTIQMLEPVSRSIFVASALASTLSFFYPILQSLF